MTNNRSKLHDTHTTQNNKTEKRQLHVHVYISGFKEGTQQTSLSVGSSAPYSMIKWVTTGPKHYYGQDALCTFTKQLCTLIIPPGTKLGDRVSIFPKLSCLVTSTIYTICQHAYHAQVKEIPDDEYLQQIIWYTTQ